jgi:hypothetical protein
MTYFTKSTLPILKLKYFMIPWEVSMKFEQFKPLFQILQIMEKHYAGGYHKSTASTVVCQNLKI